MANVFSGKIMGLLGTSGFGALSAAIAMAAIPADALAQNRGDRAREWQGEQQSQSGDNPGHSRQRQSQTGDGNWRERAANGVEARGDNRAERIDDRSEARGLRVREQGDRAAARAREAGDTQRAERIERRSDSDARTIERHGDWRARRVDQRSEQRADTIREGQRPSWPTRTWRDDDQQRTYQGDRPRDWERNRTYRSPDRNEGYRERTWRDRSLRDTNRDYRRWDRNWRNQDRYDWRDYRARDRDRYRIGRYHSPYRNYSYRRLSIGFYLDTLFFGSRYWIDDPWYYRLPEVYGPYRWVRYYDDVLLVDIYSGEVVDVIYDFFW